MMRMLRAFEPKEAPHQRSRRGSVASIGEVPVRASPTEGARLLLVQEFGHYFQGEEIVGSVSRVNLIQAFAVA